MSSKKLSIRPVLNLISIIPDEDFQNTTLRPVLKLQHDIIVLLFNNFCKKHKITVYHKKEDVLITIQKILQNNLVLRNQFIGLVIGMFTAKEFTIYITKETEFNKRILSMIGQRILDNQLTK